MELPATLDAIRIAMSAQSLSGECLVVDNNSTDTTREVALERGADRVVFEPVNQIARARNTGAAATRARFLVFVDADTRIAPALLSEALQLLDGGTCAGGGAVLEFESRIGWIGRATCALWEGVSKLTRTAAGSFLFCRRDAFDAVGGFDQKLYASEEVRISRLLRKWGRTQGLRFEIITHTPARTSARKLQWYSGPKLLAWILFMLLVPIAVRSRALCRFWYERPDMRK